MDVVKVWADMVHCRPVDLGNAFARRLKKLETTIRNHEALTCANICRQSDAKDLEDAALASASAIEARIEKRSHD